MYSNSSGRDRAFTGRGVPIGMRTNQPRPASRAPHASTAKIDLSELRNPSAIYTQAEMLAARSAPPPAAQITNAGARRFGPPSSSSSFNATFPQDSASQTLARVSDLAPFASGSSSSLYRTVLKTPTLTQLYMHGQFSSNAPDVLRQFTAELRFFHTVQRHKNIVAFVGSLEGVGMLLEYVEGETLFKCLGQGMPMSVRADWFNQILSGLCHIHSFGLAHTDLCSLNVIITIPNSPTSSSKTCSDVRSTSIRYVVKLIDFGRSTVEPKPAPIPSALAALRARPAPSVPTHEEKQRQKMERERDLIFPGTRPFASPEIMRAWKMSEAGSNQILQDEEDNDEDSRSDSESELSDFGVRDMEVESLNEPPPYVPTPDSPLPLPLSTPAYARAPEPDSSPPPLVAGTRMRAKLPIVSFTENFSSSEAQNPPSPTPSSSHPGSSRVARQRDRSYPHHTRSPIRNHPYPSPISSPPGSQPSSPHHPRDTDFPAYPFDPGFDVDDGTSDSRHPSHNQVSRSPSVHRFALPSLPTPTHRHRQSLSHSRTRPDTDVGIISNGHGQKSLSKRARKATQMAKISSLYSVDPFPLSPILGDTYSLGVIALCLDVDELVDVQPGVQMCEEWDWMGEFVGKGSGLFRGKGAVGGGEWGLVERYMRSVKGRERCRVNDVLDVDELRQVEREDEIVTRVKGLSRNVPE